MIEFGDFYKNIVSKKRFYFPLLFFAIVGYSFSIYNRTVGIDDLMKDYYIGGDYMLSSRWGMVFWNKLVGTTVVYDPFIDRFLALILLIIGAILLCYILYSIDKGKSGVIPYTILASVFITYPLINEIWVYTGANYMVGGNICLVSLAVVMMEQRTQRWRWVYASMLILLPISSYETAIFYYIALVSIVVFYKQIGSKDSLKFIVWLKEYIAYFIPVIIAFILRFAVSYAINSLYDLQYHGGGATAIMWLEDNFFHALKCMFAFNVVNYGVYSLVYFPITIFIFCLFLFVVYVLSLKRGRITAMALGVVIVVSLFSQSILQGYELSYRHAQTITLFVAFVAYLLSVSVNRKFRIVIYVLLFGLCWHQAVYLNRILGLNNLRSDNELAAIRNLGSRIESEYDKKPVVIVSQYSIGNYIRRSISVDETTWNGRLFFLIYEKAIAKLDRPFKYVGNCNSATWQQIQLQGVFDYCGFDLEIKPKYIINGVPDDKLLVEATQIAREKSLKPYQIYDNGAYLIVNLGGNFYER